MKVLIAPGDDRSAKLWNARTGKLLRTIQKRYGRGPMVSVVDKDIVKCVDKGCTALLSSYRLSHSNKR